MAPTGWDASSMQVNPQHFVVCLTVCKLALFLEIPSGKWQQPQAIWFLRNMETDFKLPNKWPVNAKGFSLVVSQLRKNFPEA